MGKSTNQREECISSTEAKIAEAQFEEDTD